MNENGTITLTYRKVEIVTEQVSISTYIGHHIKELRKQKGLTQEELSEYIGVSRASIVNIEKGRQSATYKNLFLICKCLGIKSSDLLPF
jgi:transcriptional regulator with XRE-family HTH domain